MDCMMSVNEKIIGKMKKLLFNDIYKALGFACCDDAVEEKDNVFYVKECECKVEKELKVEDIKVTKEHKVANKKSK